LGGDLVIIPTPMSWINGTHKVNDTNLNAQIRDPLTFLLNQPNCLAHRAAALNIATSTALLVPLDAEVSDNDTMHNNATNPSRVVFTTSGRYLVVASIQYGPSAAGKRTVQLRRNAAGSATGGSLQVDYVFPGVTGVTTPTQPIVTAIFRFNAGDYIEMFAYQDSGGTLAITPGADNTYLHVQRLGNL
jgi:hypothetical protein